MVKPYELTDEHRKLLPEWAEKWNQNALSTKEMDDEERDICRTAVRGLYTASGKAPPALEHIWFVPSPFRLRFESGYQAAVASGKVGAKEIEPDPSYKPDQQSLSCDMDWASERANELRVGMGGVELSRRSHEYWQGGNQWSSWVADITFYRYIARLGETHGVDYTDWDHWERLCVHSGPRTVVRDVGEYNFAVISDRPSEVHLDDQRRLHNEKGLAVKWRDGTGIYSIEGHYVPRWIVETPDKITCDAINGEENLETRRIMTQQMGLERYLIESSARIVDGDASFTNIRKKSSTLTRILMEDPHGQRFMVGTDGGTGRVYVMEVPSGCRTCEQAHVFLAGVPDSRVVLQG